MKWYRAPEDLDPPTWTTLDNRVIDDDLSCRALGLLTRWLRRPPGVEIDSIPDMVKRAKREGRTNFEGRDALYAASYELERAGYLVRELVTVKGRHEWVVRIYSRPVPPERRSDPEDRKRASGAASGPPHPRRSAAGLQTRRSHRFLENRIRRSRIRRTRNALLRTLITTLSLSPRPPHASRTPRLRP
ncbi:hypothetical protein ACFQWA_28035 [Streptomyces thermogriseus]|uniref:hypothetical protein n=1 Tax=Streptomyces thermogriseus TaxID=75292 RepID=UPI00360CB1B5